MPATEIPTSALKIVENIRETTSPPGIPSCFILGYIAGRRLKGAGFSEDEERAFLEWLNEATGYVGNPKKTKAAIDLIWGRKEG